jgi:hypothetical protein
MRFYQVFILSSFSILLPAAHAATSPLSLKLQQVEFVETPIADAVKYLQQRSAELDPLKRGLNIVINPKVDLSLATSLALSDVTIGVCLICFVEQAGVDYRKDAHAFMIVPPGEGVLAEKELESKANHANSEQASRARALQLTQIEFKEAPLRDVLGFISAKSREGGVLNTGLNIVVDHQVDQELPVTLRLNQVPASAALSYVARVTGVEIRIEPWAIMIEPPGTKFYREARIRKNQEEARKSIDRNSTRKRGTAPALGTPPEDPRSPAHPDYVHSANPDVSKRTNALNNVYKWSGGKWTFVKYGSGDEDEGGLKTGTLGAKR